MTTPDKAHALGPADPNEPMTATVIVRPHRPAPSESEIEAQALKPVADRAYLPRKAADAPHEAAPADLEAVGTFARRHGLNVVESNPALRRVVLSGKASDFESAFGVRLQRFQGETAAFRGTADEVRLPPELHPVVECVLGLDDRPAARPHS
jgi:kumamolisin